MASLSRRGQTLIDKPPMPSYIAEHFARVGQAWDRETHPQAYINLSIAENKLNKQDLNAALAQYTVPADVLGYDAMIGNYAFRQRLGAFMGRCFLGQTFAPEQLAVVAGAGAVLEMLCYAICDAGDGVLIPTPSYAGFWFDLETRDEVNAVPVHCASVDDFLLTPSLLDAALESAACPIKALLFTNPNNPLGIVYTRAQVQEVVEWAARRQVHLIVDEIYALSVFGDVEFVSAAALGTSLGDYVHIVWAFSKDFGASGLRCGVLVSENEALMSAISSMAYWAACSGHTQHLLSELINDKDTVDTYLLQMQKTLGRTYAAVTEALSTCAIKYLNAQAAFFLLIDLREFLAAQTWAAERELWLRILNTANVNLTPGEACRINEPGFFRLCYASESTAAVEAAIVRLGRVLRS